MKQLGNKIQKSYANAVAESAKTPPVVKVGPKLPDFHKLGTDDDVACYLSTFERLATAAKTPKDEWPRLLEPYLTGKAQKAFHSLSDIDKCDYDKIVEVIHRRYFLTPEEYRLKYKSDTKKADETFEEFAHRLEDNFNKWIKIPSAKREDVDTKRALNLVMIDQFLSTVRDEQLRLKLREKELCIVVNSCRQLTNFSYIAGAMPPHNQHPTNPSAELARHYLNFLTNQMHDLRKLLLVRGGHANQTNLDETSTILCATVVTSWDTESPTAPCRLHQRQIWLTNP